MGSGQEGGKGRPATGTGSEGWAKGVPQKVVLWAWGRWLADLLSLTSLKQLK